MLAARAPDLHDALARGHDEGLGLGYEITNTNPADHPHRPFWSPVLPRSSFDPYEPVAQRGAVGRLLITAGKIAWWG